MIFTKTAECQLSPHSNNASRIVSWEDVENFLQSGFFIRLDEKTWLLAWEPVEHGMFEWAAFVPNFFMMSEKPWRSFANWRVVQVQELKSLFADKSLPRFQTQWSSPDQGQFHSAFGKSQEAFKSGRLQKTVPLTVTTGEGVPSWKQRASLIQALLETTGRLTSYGYWDEEGGLVGYTPETLFAFDTSSVETMALAGTAPVGVPLLSDPKQWHEHQIVVEGLLNRIENWGEVEKGTTYEWQIGRIQHLRTDIRVRLMQTFSYEDICRRLHPTAALAGYPVEDSMHFLKEHNGLQRKRFGAPFGVRFSDGSGFAVVAIRNLQWDREQTMIASGCGLVAGSQFEKEWAEHLLKQSVVKEVFGL